MENNFSKLHPLSNIVFFIFMIIFSMFTMNPILVGIMLLESYVYFIYLNGFRSSKKLLFLVIPILIFSCIIIPFFSHNGVTPLFYINDMPFTLETVIFGLVTGGVLMSVIMWLQTATNIIDNEKFLYLTGRLFPTLALIVSMSFRMIPLFIRRYREIGEAQYGIGRNPKDMKAINRFKFTIKKVSILISWSLENSMNTTMSMESRGYGVRRRSSFHLYQFKKKDAIFMIVIFALLIFPFITLVTNGFKVYFFPEMDLLKVGINQVISYCLIGIAGTLPFIVDLTGSK